MEFDNEIKNADDNRKKSKENEAVIEIKRQLNSHCSSVKIPVSWFHELNEVLIFNIW